MTLPSRLTLVGLACGLSLASQAGSQATASPGSPAPKTAEPVSGRARGSFDVKLTPEPFEGQGEGSPLGRMSIEKTFLGDLVGTSRGAMLSAMSDVKGSAGYVALERVSGTLAGRNGSFVLQHSGTLARGAPTLVITVVPDTGSGQLAGLDGHMSIDIAPDGKHSYVFEYTLPPAP